MPARIGLAGLVLVASGCAGAGDEAADGDGRVIVEDHTQPDGRVVRAGLGDIVYSTHLEGEKEGIGLVVEIHDGDGRRSVTFPIPPIDEDFQVLGGFGGGFGTHVWVLTAPADTVLGVRPVSGDEYDVDVGPDRLAVVVAPSADALDRVQATAPDGTQCWFVRAPYAGVDCTEP